jgi:hypothetical protein
MKSQNLGAVEDDFNSAAQGPPDSYISERIEKTL